MHSKEFGRKLERVGAKSKAQGPKKKKKKLLLSVCIYHGGKVKQV